MADVRANFRNGNIDVCCPLGIILPKDTNADFLRITDRICKATIKRINQPNIVIICGYAPTLERSKKYPNTVENFYNNLESTVNTVNKRDFLIVGGDFNAKTGSAYKLYSDCMGRHGKGQVNANGLELLNFCLKTNMFLTNTKYNVKMAHRTTWQAPDNDAIKHYDGNDRINPIRNQIDYVMIRKQNISKMKNSRSYSGIKTKTDHRLVILDLMNIDKPEFTKKTKKEPRINFELLKDAEISNKYKNELEQKLNNIDMNKSPQEKWNETVERCHATAKEVMGEKDNTKRSRNAEIMELSNKQKELNIKINSNIDSNTRNNLRITRNRIQQEIRIKIKLEEEQKIIEIVAEIENTKDDSYKMFKAIRALNQLKQKQQLIIETEDGVTSNQREQVRIITNFFKEFFNNQEMPRLLNIVPTKMNKPFMAEEIKLASKKLKNDKSPGIDKIRAEQIKYGPDKINNIIADILNETAESGNGPRELKSGILRPLQKPLKKRGPLTNLRPVILMSTLRKILSICLINRISDRILNHIPASQAAYQRNRSTTEHVFAFKLLTEKAIISEDYSIFILLMDMSKAFDTVNRTTLMEDLKNIIDTDELHMVKILLEEVEIAVKCGNEIGVSFKTNSGVPQGDCLSAILFILYLSKALQINPQLQDHNYSKPENHKPQEIPKEIMEHDYRIPNEIIFELENKSMIIPTQYSDDCGYIIISKNKQVKEYKKAMIPIQLKKRGLVCNDTKTEEYRVERKGEELYKKCKYLGSYLDTTEDIKHRKILALNSMKKLYNIWEDRHLSLKYKIRIFESMVKPIFLYNSQLWGTNDTINGQINAFQRRLLRMVLNIKWPNKISNDELYNIFKYENWSKVIGYMRMKWLGHVFRLNGNTPARIAIEEARRRVKKPSGRSKTNWLKTILEQLETININIDDVENLAQNREQWRKIAWDWKRQCEGTPS